MLLKHNQVEFFNEENAFAYKGYQIEHLHLVPKIFLINSQDTWLSGMTECGQEMEVFTGCSCQQDCDQCPGPDHVVSPDLCSMCHCTPGCTCVYMCADDQL